MSDTYAISRIDLPLMKTHGWQVRLRRQGKLFSKFFSDSKNGGYESAFLLAKDADYVMILPKIAGFVVASIILIGIIRNAEGNVGL